MNGKAGKARAIDSRNRQFGFGSMAPDLGSDSSTRG
jgi:hypothetical protein